jgi:hypothetical protein
VLSKIDRAEEAIRGLRKCHTRDRKALAVQLLHKRRPESHSSVNRG